MSDTVTTPGAQPSGQSLETDDGIWAIHFNTVLPATFDERDYIVTG